MRRTWRLGLLVGILLLAWGLRVSAIALTGIEIDEAFSVTLASYGLADIVRGTAADQHPPLYYLLLHGWMGLAGESLFALRLLSTLIGLATVALLYRLGSSLGRGVGLLAAALLAISPVHIHFSPQVRMYALLVLLGALSTWLAWRWWSLPSARGWQGSILYGLVALAALYTHNFGLLLLVAQNVAGLTLGLIEAKENRRQLAARWLAIQGVILIGFLPWLPVMIDQVMHHRMDWIPPIHWSVVRNSWLFLLFYSDWRGTALDSLRALLGLTLVLLALWPRQGAAARQGGEFLNWTGLWFTVPILAVIAVSYYRPIYQNKQLLIVLPALILLLAVGLFQPRRWLWRGILMAGMVTLIVVSLIEGYQNPRQQHWDSLSAYLDAHAQSGDLLYVNAAAGYLGVSYYLEADLPVAFNPPGYDLLQGGWVGELATEDSVEAQLAPLAEQHPHIWLVEFAPRFWDPQGFILSWLQSHYHQVESIQFNGIRLVLYAREITP